MLKGIHLTLMIGPAVPIPVSKEVLDALTSVEVTINTQGPSGFQLSFNLSTRSPLHTLFLLSGGNVIPLIRVIIIVTLNGTSEVLMDGVMTHHQITPDTGSGQVTLTITGEDLSRVMDYIDFKGIPYPAMPAEARVAVIIAKYSFLGIIPMVIPSVLFEVPNPIDKIPLQEGTDLNYVKQLADEVGYTFYVDPGPKPGMSIAYWGPEIKIGIPQPPLNVDMDAHTNVESLNFSFDTESKVQPVVFIHSQALKVSIPIPIPDITPLNPPLGLVPPIPKHIYPLSGTAKLSPIQAALIGLAKAAKTADAVSASGNLDVLRYGRVLKARQLISVRGAGTAFDGLYYVKSVTHNIKRGEFKQNFTLSRNGLVSTLSRVPV
ncbi:MAG: hypothetical protein HC877_20900 [Thioploca sp.]|nr:hypothetical protein [Thioploca sp.]